MIAQSLRDLIASSALRETDENFTNLWKELEWCIFKHLIKTSNLSIHYLKGLYKRGTIHHFGTNDLQYKWHIWKFFILILSNHSQTKTMVRFSLHPSKWIATLLDTLYINTMHWCLMMHFFEGSRLDWF